MIRTIIQYNGEAFVALFARPNWSESVEVTEATLTEIETSRLGKEYRRSGAHAPAVSKISYTSTLRAQDAQDWRSFNSYLGSMRVVVPVWPDAVTYARRATMAHDSGFVICWDTGFTNVVLTDSSTIPETEYVAPALIGSIKLNDDIPLTDFDGDVEIEVSLIPLTSVLAGYSDPFASGYMIPEITDQPDDVSQVTGTTVTLTVVAVTNDISGPLTYQWYFGTVVLVGATSASYSFTRSDTTDGGYYVVVSNDVGPVQSNTVTISLATWQLLSDTNVTASSDIVSSWDTTDSNYSFTQATIGIQPVVDSSDLLNGIAPIRFTNDYLLSTTTVGLPTGADPFTLSCLLRCRSAVETGGDTRYAYVWGYGGMVNTNQPRALGCRRASSTVWWDYSSAASTIDSDDSEVCLITVTYDGTTQKLYRNGTLIGSGEEVHATVATQFSIGTWTSVINERVADCSIWEISAFSVALSSEEISDYLEYINSRYGISLT
jgi:hypothetical protein